MNQVLIKMTKNRSWENTNIFITGCTGLLGPRLTESLISQNAHIIGLVRDLVPKPRFYQPEIFNHVVEVRCEIENYTLLERILNEYKIRDQYLSAKKSKKIMEWKSQCSLDYGLKETVEWYVNFFKNYQHPET
jgi:nucleoside-diphosphate-sugar epimerase